MKAWILLLACACAPGAHEVVLPILPDRGVGCAAMMVGYIVTNPQNADEECDKVNSWSTIYADAFTREEDNLYGRRLAGWRVILVDGENGAFTIDHHPVSGATVCDTKQIFLATKPYGERSALPHELAHALDCVNGVPQPDSHRHKGWDEKGYCAAIDSVSTLHLVCHGGYE